VAKNEYGKSDRGGCGFDLWLGGGDRWDIFRDKKRAVSGQTPIRGEICRDRMGFRGPLDYPASIALSRRHSPKVVHLDRHGVAMVYGNPFVLMV